jgi:lipopolysaccharide heptosyltransferase I
MKILIVKLSSIGDVIHTLPALYAIKESLPEAEVSWVVERSAAEILRGNELLTRLIEIDTRSMRKSRGGLRLLPDAWRQLKELRNESFDVAIDFQGLLKSASIAWLSRSKRTIGFAREALREPISRFLYKQTVDVPERIHVVDKNLALAEEGLGLAFRSGMPEFPIFSNEAHRLEAAAIAETAGNRFVVLNPAGGWPTKLWSAESYGRLADQIWEEHGLASVVTTGPNEEALAEQVLKSSKSGKIIKSSPSLKGFFELAKRAELYVGGDTGPTFLAIAAKTPVVGIFGPTEWWRNGSPQELDICVERNDIGCRVNCHRRSCSNWICMDIDVNTVARAVTDRLAQKGAEIG